MLVNYSSSALLETESRAGARVRLFLRRSKNRCWKAERMVAVRDVCNGDDRVKERKDVEILLFTVRGSLVKKR